MSNSANNKSASTAPPSGNMRQRSRYACVPCRQRKRKCDGSFPCSTCTGYGYDCHYNSGGATINSRPNTLPPMTAAAHTTTPKRKRSTTSLDATEPISPSSQKSKSSAPINRGFGDEVSSIKDRVLPPPAAPSIQQSSPTSNDLWVASKCRHVGRHSSVAFPQWVGKNLQSIAPPRVHSFGYNTGIRRELPYSVSFQIQNYITWPEVLDSLDIYATVIDPVFGFVDMEGLRRKSNDHWHGKNQGANFEALISGVIGLASLFSKVLDETRELRVIQHAKDILDDPSIARLPRLETIQAWILRTIYIRSTSRPGAAWLYSCITIHLCETTGVYRDREPHEWWLEGHRSLETLKDICARVVMVSRSLHIIISYEHGRSISDVGPVLEHNIIKRSEDLTPQLYALASALPFDNSSRDPSEQQKQELNSALNTLISTPTSHEFFSLIKGDLCFCIYRRLRLLDLGINQEQLTQIIQAGNAALPAARALIQRNHPWWNTVGTVFQYICVLLAIDSSESLGDIPEAMETLGAIAKHLKTHLAEEALNTAKLLVRSMTEKKRKEAVILEKTISGWNPMNAADTHTHTHEQILTANNNNNNNDDNDNNDNNNDNDTHVATTTATTISNTGDTTTTLYQGDNNNEPTTTITTLQQEWYGLPDFMDLWNWDAFFEPPLATMQTAPLTDDSIY